MYVGIPNDVNERHVCIVLKMPTLVICVLNVLCWSQTGWNQDQVPHMWDLIFAHACLRFRSSISKSRMEQASPFMLFSITVQLDDILSV